jgi:FAD-dependent urate hydroxylase
MPIGSDMRDYRILIVGAGIAGLALGRALRKAGFWPEIIERATAWEAGGTGIYLPANGIRALRALGLEDRVLARAAVIRRQRFLNHRGHLLMDIDLERVWGACGPCLALPRAELHRALLDGADGVPIRMGVTPRSLEEVQRVRVVFSDGTAGEYDLVVGADGIRSSVRRLAFDDRPPVAVGQVSWRFVTTCPPGVTAWSAMLGEGKTFLTIPIGQGLVYCYCDEAAGGGANERRGGGLDRVRATFSAFAPPVPEILASLGERTEVHASPIEEVAQQCWGRGRVLLVGDAAHAMSPNMAEGASLALEDALVLAQSLESRPTVEAAAEAYGLRRHLRTRWVRQQTRRRDHLRSLPSAIRDLTLRTLGRHIFLANYRRLAETF